MSENADGSLTGELLDQRYRLVELVGQGGMARVYRATDEKLGREVAVKVMRSTMTDAEAHRRHESEVRLLATLTHPGLVTLYDGRTSDDHAYLVMEFIHGQTLAARIAQGSLSAAETAAMVADVAEAISAAHRAGIVHRDVKPSNIMLRESIRSDRTLRATLTDFGVAYLIDSTRLTTPGMVIGTVAYLAPEQARGHAVGPAADIYALGITALECLTGVRAFEGMTPQEMLVRRVSAPPSIPDGIDESWKTLIAEVTRLDPADRPSAAEVAGRADALARSLASGEAGGPPSASEAARRASVAAEPTQRQDAVEAPTATKVLTSADALGPTATTLAVPAGEAPPTDSPSRRVKPAIWIGAAAAALVIVVSAGLAIAAGAGTPSAADPVPTLPALPQPLSDHLQGLLQAVTP